MEPAGIVESTTSHIPAESLDIPQGIDFALSEGSAHGQSPQRGWPGQRCLPFQTKTKVTSPSETRDNLELRAYKLGKKRWLYNECRLNFLRSKGAIPELQIVEVTRLEGGIDPEFEDCGVAFSCKLTNLSKITVHVYVVYDEPEEVSNDVKMAETSSLPVSSRSYRWCPVRRQDCCKGCQGNILRAIQRYGRVSKRTKKAASGIPIKNIKEQAKDPRYLYLSIDEASTHVGGKRFRLIAAAFDDEKKLLATSLSLPINVLANNDAPRGPATIDIDLLVAEEWAGWKVPDIVQAGSMDLNEPSSSAYQAPLYRDPSRQLSETGSQRALRSQSSESSDPLTFIKMQALQSQSPDELLPEEVSRKRPFFGYQSDPLAIEAPGDKPSNKWNHTVSYPMGWREGQGSTMALLPQSLPPLRIGSHQGALQSLSHDPHSANTSSQTWESSQSHMSTMHRGIYTVGSPTSIFEQFYHRMPQEKPYVSMRQASAPAVIHNWRPSSSESSTSQWKASMACEQIPQDSAVITLPSAIVRSDIRSDTVPSSMIPITPSLCMPEIRQAQNPGFSGGTPDYTFNPFAASIQRGNTNASLGRLGDTMKSEPYQDPPWQ